MDRERCPSGSTSAAGASTRTARLIRAMAGAVLAVGLLLTGSSAALADGLVIGVSVSERPESPTSSGQGTAVAPSGTSDGTTPSGTAPGGSPSAGVNPGGPTTGGGSDDDLASTGLSTFWLVAPAALLVVVGARALALARRRRSSGAHAL